MKTWSCLMILMLIGGLAAACDSTNESDADDDDSDDDGTDDDASDDDTTADDDATDDDGTDDDAADDDASDDDASDDDATDDDATDDDATDDDTTDDDTTDDDATDDDTADDDATDDDAVDDDATDDDAVDDDATDDDTVVADAEWTLVVYMAADNNLYTYGLQNLAQMKTVASSADVNLIVIFDGTSYGDSRYLKVNYNSIEYLYTPGELNMGAQSTLQTTVTWAFNNYPAQKYGVIMWDHGSGWHKTAGLHKDVCEDDSASGDMLTNDEMIAAFDYILDNTAADKLDMIGFDACLMQMAEIAHYLRPYADVMVGSEETEGAQGWAYDDFLDALVADPTMTAAELGQYIGETYIDIPDATMSVAELSQLDELATAVDTLASALITAGGLGNNKLLNAADSALYFADYDYLDLYDLCTKIKAQNISTAVTNAATALQTAVNNAVYWHGYGTWGYGNEHGLSIYFPNPWYSSYDSAYNNLSWADATHWDELIAD